MIRFGSHHRRCGSTLIVMGDTGEAICNRLKNNIKLAKEPSHPLGEVMQKHHRYS